MPPTHPPTLLVKRLLTAYEEKEAEKYWGKMNECGQNSVKQSTAAYRRFFSSFFPAGYMGGYTVAKTGKL